MGHVVGMTALRVDGVDLSHHQDGEFDLAAAKAAGVKFIYHKATEGTTVWDSRYASRRTQAKAANIPFGAYHFARPDGGDAKAEAERFLKIAQPAPGDLVPMLDVEVDVPGLTLGELTDWTETWVKAVKRVVGCNPIIYTRFSLLDYFGCLVWRARYNSDNREPDLDWDIFQFSDGSLGTPNSVAGLGHVDLNHMRDGLTVADFTIPAAEPEPKPTGVQVMRPKFLDLIAEAEDRIKVERAPIRRDIETFKQAILGWPES